MTSGYTKTYTKTTGNTVEASDGGIEYTNLQAAFDASTGHNHDGTPGCGAPIPLGGNAVTGTLSLAKGGTASALVDPNADRILFWDDSGGAIDWLTVSTGLTVTTTNLTVSTPLASIAGLTTAADKMIYTTASNTYAVTSLSSFGRSFIDDADAAEARSTLGLVIGTNVQAYDSELAALADLTSAADSAPYFTGSGTASLMTVTSAARTVLDDASISSMRTTLGVAIGTDVQAYDANTAKLNVVQSFTKQQSYGIQTLTDGANIAWDMDNGASAKVTLGGNRTLSAPTHLVDGGTYLLRVIQDGSGSRTLAYNSVFHWPGDVTPTLTTTASKVDLITCTSNGTNLYCSIQQNYTA